MYRIKVGNMYLDYIEVETNPYSISNEFINDIRFNCDGSLVFDIEENAKVICDKLYIVLGIKGTVEKVGEEDE